MSNRRGPPATVMTELSNGFSNRGAHNGVNSAKLWSVLELILKSGAIGRAIMAAAYLLWRVGVRDPFILTGCALLIGVAAGWGVNVALGS